MIAGAFVFPAFAQPTVTVTGPDPTNCPTPAGEYRICATASGGTIAKVVFYRNDVPYETDISSPYRMTSTVLGQDTYVFRARAYDSSGLWTDSAEIDHVVNRPQVLTMDGSTYVSGILLEGPGSFKDHTDGIQAALDQLSVHGGTLFFPCQLPPDPYLPAPAKEQAATYTISRTIRVPSNVTLQGEGSERWGKCRIYWYNWNESYTDPNNEQDDCYYAPASLRDRPMFQLIGGSSGVRFRDLALYSRSSGNGCYPRNDVKEIRNDRNTGIEMNASVDKHCFDDQTGCDGNGGNISDVIFDNVSINDFTWGIKAYTKPTQSFEISGIKIRGYRAQSNHRQLYIDAPYAYDWDIQNLNISAMTGIPDGDGGQGGVEITRAGYPTSYTGLNPGIKFLQLNCNGNTTARPDFCVQVMKHGGLYFRQMAHERAPRAIDVKKLDSGTNPDPIVFESGIVSGRFEDPSMKLYLVGNGVQAPDALANGLDDARLRFIGEGVDSTVLDCGDVHSDWTDVVGTHNPTEWGDLQMMFTHMERNRASFYATGALGYKFIKGHKYCVESDPSFPNANEIGGKYFDNGILPSEVGVYSNTIDAGALSSSCGIQDVATCIEDYLDYRVPGSSSPALATHGGSLYIIGHLTVDRTVRVPRGAQIIGAPDAQITLTKPDRALFQIVAPIGGTDGLGYSGTVIRDLLLDLGVDAEVRTGTSGIEIVNEAADDIGVSRDMHFSRLTFEYFDIGIHAHPVPRPDPDPDPLHPAKMPMIDGLSLKRMTFYGNNTAVKIDSANASNWNVMNLNMTAKIGMTGWHQLRPGNQGLQHVTCTGIGTNRRMADCIKLQLGVGFFLMDLRKPQYTVNALTTELTTSAFGGIYTALVPVPMVIRDSDFTSSSTSQNNINLIGKAFITSMNNKYSNFTIGSTYEGDKSRVTYCGDTYSGTPYSGIAPLYKNLWVGIDTPTLVSCGPRAIPWEDPVSLGGVSNPLHSAENDVPLVGNFYDTVQEDLVIFRPKTATSDLSQFLIKSQDGIQHNEVQFGDFGDIPLTAHFYAGQNSQIVTFKPSTGTWRWVDPVATPLPTPTPYYWGMSGDTPFVGNFLDDADNLDEIAIYRSSDYTIWLVDPRTNTYRVHPLGADHGKDIHVGDFLGLGYDQIAQFVASTGTWYILNGDTGAVTTGTLGQAGDVAVPGHYLPKPAPTGYQDCTQLGVWRPSDQKFLIKDGDSACGSRDETTYKMIWGSNNDLDSTNTAADDIPLAIRNSNGISRPASYRPDAGVFPKSVAAGQWWIHDPFVP